MGEPRKSNNQSSTRLDLSAPVERTYLPDRKAILAALRIVLRSAAVASTQGGLTLMPNSITRIATYARVSSDEQRERHTVLNQREAPWTAVCRPSRVLSSSSITRTMASQAPSRSKTGRAAARSCATHAPVASPKSGSYAPIDSGATNSDYSTSGDSSTRSASPSTLPTRTSRTRSRTASRPSSPPMNAASSSNAPQRA